MPNVSITSPNQRVGLRALREDLSSYVGAVKAGHTLTVTEHGRPVARLIPAPETESAYERLVAQGVIRPARRTRAELEDPVTVSGLVSDLIEHQRR